jgi:hypothetical protein
MQGNKIPGRMYLKLLTELISREDEFISFLYPFICLIVFYNTYVINMNYFVIRKMYDYKILGKKAANLSLLSP